VGTAPSKHRHGAPNWTSSCRAGHDGRDDRQYSDSKMRTGEADKDHGVEAMNRPNSGAWIDLRSRENTTT
jgi:hypothetical protein